MISSEQPAAGDEPFRDAAPLQMLEDLLDAAMRLADSLDLAFPAIRIEEALMMVRAHAARAQDLPRGGTPTPFN